LNTERPVTLREHGGASVPAGNNVERIRKEYQDGLKQPLFESIPGGFAATVFAKNKNVTDNVVENVTGNVTDNRIDSLLNLINKNNKITTQKLADILGFSLTISLKIGFLSLIKNKPFRKNVS
jgi:predicted HTH transcriptional regulator